MKERSALLASQPIYNRSNEVHAVELLFRNDLNQSAMDVGDTRATSELLFNLCTGITDQTEHYHSPAFINVSGDFLLSQGFLPIDPNLVVIELVERMEPTEELVAAVARWHEQGFRFALDDFEFTPAWDELLKFASVIKVDVCVFSPEQVAEHQKRLSHLDCLWLAERVEDEATRSVYMNMGFDLFQGYFFAKPAIIFGKKLTPAALHLARLLSALYTSEPDVDELAGIISADPGVAVSLLKVINSPIYRSSSRITSVKEVVLRLGINNLRRWVALVAVVNAASPQGARIILARAQACQELSIRAHSKSVDPSQAFLVGLLSGVDVLLGVDRHAFLENLCISEEVQNALNGFVGPLGKNLQIVIDVERAVQMKDKLHEIDHQLLTLYRHASESVQLLLDDA
ncbi:HDOD domain-containing protein [Vreelandella venusta]|uniref:EAL and HDOD domain-containing protein n=1 Tax=Vreelandella venusta TaxID=44935 RepID=UPI00384B1E2F